MTPRPERELTSGRSWITRKERKGSTVGLLKTMRPVASLKARRALCQSSTNPYCEGADVRHRVLHGALSRLEPSAVKVACSVLRGGVDRKVCPLPDIQRKINPPNI